MRSFLTRRDLFIAGAIVTASALVMTSAPVANADTSITSTTKSLSQQIAAAYASPAGTQVLSQVGALFADPNLPVAADALLLAHGPAGANDLSEFQVASLKALDTESKFSTAIQARLTGQPLTKQIKSQLAEAREKLGNNDAIEALSKAGKQLGRSQPQLSADTANVISNNGQVYSILTPPATANQGGSAALDEVISRVAALRTSSAFNALTTQLTPILNDPSFPALLRSQPSLVLANFLPTQSGLISDAAVMSAAAAAASSLDIFKATFEILGGLAAVGGAILLAPEVITVAVGVGLGLTIFAGFSAVVVGVIDLATALDCDHDGDPFDPADIPGQEC